MELCGCNIIDRGLIEILVYLKSDKYMNRNEKCVWIAGGCHIKGK